MRPPASGKLEIIRLVEQSHLPARRTLEMLGMKPSTFYRWYDRFGSDGPETKRLCIWLKTKCVHDVANSSRTGMFFPLRDQSAI